jgi:beta-mannosidase
MDLGGAWRAAESNEELRRLAPDPAFDDSGWPELRVPGHWRSHPAFAASDGPILYRRPLSHPALAEGERAFLVLDGIFYLGDVWLDGDYVGDTEGYFFPHAFEVTDTLRAGGEHVLAVEVNCPPPSDLKAKRSLTGVFQHWDCIDPAWNPGGIWSGVRIERTGPVRITALKTLCREASEERAVLEFEASLDAPGPGTAQLRTTVQREPDATPAPAVEHHQEQMLSAGANVVRWRVAVERPELWWPRALGAQPLYRVEVEVDRPDQPGRLSDGRSLVTGLRHIRVRNFIATVNGERLFLKGANYGPVSRALADASAEDCRRDIALAADAGLDLLRVHGHVSRPELYEAADRAGMLIWQDLPLQWGYGNVRRQAVIQARQAVAVLGHHPSIALWCGHNEPVALEMSPGEALSPRTVARMAAGQVLPTWNKTALDRSIRRALERADGSREVVAHSGILPHPAWGTDSHFYYGWYHGEERDFPAILARLPVVARFVSEFGAQAVPDSADFMNPSAWPDLDWENLEAHHCLQRDIFDRRVPSAEHATFDSWRKATQAYQADLLRHHIETLRRLKYRPTGGFCLFMLTDSQPAVSWSIVDHERVPKAGYAAVAAACAPVIVTASRPDASYRGGDRLRLDIHVVSDLRGPLEGAVVDVTLDVPGGRRVWRFGGEVPADSCVKVGRISADLPTGAAAGDVAIDLALRWEGASAPVSNRYTTRLGGVS